MFRHDTKLTSQSAPLVRLLICFVLFAGTRLNLAAQDLASFEKRITTKVLPNGLTLIICERPEAPVFSFYTVVNAGDANDPSGESGLAHMFEHLAFKGTKTIGTRNYPAEQVALDKVEQTYAAYDAEFRKRVGQDPAKLKQLHDAFDSAVKSAQEYVIPNQFTETAEQNGATGINASTGLDTTQYFWSMPSNRLELWAYMESDRIANPVPREFYKERDVVMEERRMRTESSPEGRMLEQFLATAYVAHPYHRPNVGWMSELSQITATEAMAFHSKYYVPANIVVAVVGDVQAQSVLPTLEKYFGAIPAGPLPEDMTTVEPRQPGERSVVLKQASQPLYIEGYHKPDYRDPDNAVYDAITDVFSNGRTSRLYRSLVRDQQIAAVVEGFSGYPGDKYPGLFAFIAVPLPEHTPQQMRDGIHKEIDKLKTSDVTDEELAMFKTRARADLLRGLGENQGLAEQLAVFQQRYGDWRELFHQLDRIDKVSKADIRRVSNKIFIESNRTSATVEFQPPSPPQGQPSHNGGAQ
ncbi:MAG TPA: pitrilysin family protein [Acidisarcina sp.]